MNSQQLQSISVLAELDRAGIDYETAGEEEIKILCPFHNDKHPSCAINVKKNLFSCHTAGCNAKGDVLTLFAKILGTTRRVIFEDMSKRYDLEEVKIIDSSVVERWHADIWKAKLFIKQLYDRGIKDDTIRKYRIGFNGRRITIPVYNRNHQYVNVRQYLPGAPGPEKMRNTRGHGGIRLYPIDQLKYDKIVLCGGEMKALVVAQELNKKGYGAVTVTAGEGKWDSRYNDDFKGKQLWVCYDIDAAGMKAAESICARLKAHASFVRKVNLPLSIDAYPKGDINDYFGKEKGTAKEFQKILEATEDWEPKRPLEVDTPTEVIDLPLADSSRAETTGKRIRMKANIAAMDTAPYVIPKRIRIQCDRSQEGCSMCPVFLEKLDADGFATLELHPESPAILDMVAASKNFQRDALMAGLRIPQCKVVEFTPVEWYNVEDIRLSPQLEITSRAIDDILLPALFVGHGLETNESYIFTGRMYPHPKTQQSVLLISEATATQDALSNFKPPRSQLQELQIFQPDEWTVESLESKLQEIYDDLSANITRIYKRHPLHLIIDLTYHSCLLFEFDGTLVKGWVETLIAGDSAQGKSETLLRLMHHYNLGERVECKNATVAGLLGGLQQLGTRWFVTWGVIPKHDKRIVALEEIKGTSTEVIGRLTDMRSSGIAEIPKIEKRRTHARTRLMMISNPRSDRTLSMYNFGIEAVRELIGSPEDIRRFDAVLLVASTEIEPDELNRLQQFRPNVPHVFTGDLCRNLVLWAWTRSEKEVTFDQDAYTLILKTATEMSNKYSEIVPIVDRGSMRYKLARLAIALACRTYSNHNLTTVRVRECHVQFIVNFLQRTYSDSLFGYLDFSEAVKARETLQGTDLLKTRLLQTPFPRDIVKELLYTDDIQLRDICDWTGWERGDALQLLSLLVRKHALVRDNRGYRKTAKFIEFLKALSASDEMQAYDRPGHIEEEF